MEDIKKKDEAYMRRALIEAQAAFDEDEIPVGAIIVCKDRIISRAHNLTEMLTDVTAHAEMQAITSGANMLGGKYLKDCTLYVTVEPCVMCAGALGWAQISRVVYGAGDEAEFVLNGKSLGRKPIEKLMASMDIPYEPGILEGVVYKDGAKISRSTLVTPKEAAVLELVPYIVHMVVTRMDTRNERITEEKS